MSASGFLLDTNVISEALRPRPEKRVVAWLREHDARSWLSVVTIGEIEAGIRGAPDPRRAEALSAWLDRVLIPQFSHRILRVDLEVARAWGARVASARARGTPAGAVDALIAATAAQHGLSVATRNVRDFAHLDVDTVDPWAVA